VINTVCMINPVCMIDAVCMINAGMVGLEDLGVAGRPVGAAA